MIKKILKRFRIVDIDVIVYHMAHVVVFDMPHFPYQLEKSRIKNSWRYAIRANKTQVHVSYLYDSVYLLKLLNKKGPVIGDCLTHRGYRGQSIYPYVINTIASEALKADVKEIFIVVNKDNQSSIKGIEKAGFNPFATIIGTRWLWFYFKKQITYY